LQYSKHDDLRISTLHGIEIDGSPERANACDSIRLSVDGDSNEIEEHK
jgi:hypothetical protein